MAAVFTGLSLSFVVICVLVHSRDFAVVVFARLRLTAPMPTTTTIQTRAAKPAMERRHLSPAASRILPAVGEPTFCVFTSAAAASSFSNPRAGDGGDSPM